MTNMPEEEKIAWVIAAAAQLRVGATPRYELWPTILERLEVQGTRQRRSMPWITFVIVVLLLIIGGSILSSKIEGYRASRARAIALSPEGFRERLSRADRMTSDHDKATMLISLVESARADTNLVSAIIQVARPIDSSFEKARVLLKLAENRVLTTPALRSSFIAAANTISSKAERDHVLDAMERLSRGSRPFFRPDELSPRR
jgi:hypothetical protein